MLSPEELLERIKNGKEITSKDLDYRYNSNEDTILNKLRIKQYEKQGKKSFKGLPPTTAIPPMPPVKPPKNCGSCDTCIKEDVCVYKDSYLSAKSDIELIEDRTNVFMDNIIRCDKWANKISLR